MSSFSTGENKRTDFMNVINKEIPTLMSLGDIREILSQHFTSSKIFPCPTYSIFNYLPRPNSVNMLLPNNIEVIAAMGDSQTAANGAKLKGTPIQDRGISWSIGGESSSITDLITLPSKIFTGKRIYRIFLYIKKLVSDILRLYNPKIYGYSTGTGSVNDSVSVFNVATPGHDST